MKRKPVRIEPLEKTFDATTYLGDFQRIIKGADGHLACAVIATALVEKALMSLLARFLRQCPETDNMFGVNGELESFSKCTRMAYCLGLISEPIKKNLETLGRVRNRFAHNDRILDFNDSIIAEWCRTGLK